MIDMADSTIERERAEPGDTSFTVSGHDRQVVLAAGLEAVLQYVVPRDTLLATAPDSRAAAIRGEGPDLAALFADLVTHLLEHLEEAGGEAVAVRLDGLLRKDQGGFVAWGYLDLPAMPGPAVRLPRLTGTPEVNEADGQPVSIRITLRR
jgi:hypothetical protein